MVHLFLPQALLEEWVSNDQADLKEEGKLAVREDNASHPIQPAVSFSKLVSGADDKKLVGKVKTQTELQTLGAEQMMDSVILGEDAYEIVPGYVVQVQPPAPPKGKGSDEASLLAEYFLDKIGS